MSWTANVHLESAYYLILWVSVIALLPSEACIEVDALSNLVHTKRIRRSPHFECGSKIWHVDGDSGHPSVRGACCYTRGMNGLICHLQDRFDRQNIIKK
jgi:hypothetical protein